MRVRAHLSALCVAALALACERRAASGGPSASSSVATAGAPAPAEPATVDRAGVSPAPVEAPSAAPAAVELGAEHAFAAGTVQEVAPAAPATAARNGVVLLARGDRAILALSVAQPGRAHDAVTIRPVEEPQAGFAAFERGPAVLGEHAYWVSKGRLVRQRLTRGSRLEKLTDDARDGTRVSVAWGTGVLPAVAAYIARTSDPARLIAKLWVDGAPALDLSPEGAAASSVSLVPAGGELVAVTLEGRTSMTPVHARRIRTEGGRLSMSEDVVVWVGGSSQALTEVVALPSDGRIAVLLAMERDATHFGLVRISVPMPPRMSSQAAWQLYPNGLDPAPVAPAEVCGRPVAVFARPSETRPRAPQELVLATVDRDNIAPPIVLARAPAFADVSVASVEGGALVAWVARRRTWALPLGCRSPAPSK